MNNKKIDKRENQWNRAISRNNIEDYDRQGIVDFEVDIVILVT